MLCLYRMEFILCTRLLLLMRLRWIPEDDVPVTSPQVLQVEFSREEQSLAADPTRQFRNFQRVRLTAAVLLRAPQGVLLELGGGETEFAAPRAFEFRALRSVVRILAVGGDFGRLGGDSIALKKGPKISVPFSCALFVLLFVLLNQD